MSEIEDETKRLGRSYRPCLKHYTLRLRPDQIAFLKTISNASAFIREALDNLIAETDRSCLEKTIALHEAVNELEEKIREQIETIRQVKNETPSLDFDIKKLERWVIFCEEIMKGKFDVYEIMGSHGSLFEACKSDDGRSVKIAEGQTRQEASDKAQEKITELLKKQRSRLTQLIERRQRQTQLLETHQRKLENMKVQLEKLKSKLA